MVRRLAEICAVQQEQIFMLTMPYYSPALFSISITLQKYKNKKTIRGNIMTYAIAIMPASEVDLDAAGQLIFDSIHGLAHTHYSPEELKAWAPKPYAGDRAKQRFEDQLFFIASDDEGMAAVMTLTPDHHLDVAYSHPRSAGTGAASQTYSTLETFARAQKVRAITSDVSFVARSFFEKRGYKVLAKQHPIANGVKLTNFNVRKDLA